jgi:hypothetical protein
VELGQVVALIVMVAVLAAWRQSQTFKRFSHLANMALIVAGIYLLFTQLHGYQHDVHGENFRFPTLEHRHAHEDMDIQNTIDKARNAL